MAWHDYLSYNSARKREALHAVCITFRATSSQSVCPLCLFTISYGPYDGYGIHVAFRWRSISIPWATQSNRLAIFSYNVMILEVKIQKWPFWSRVWRCVRVNARKCVQEIEMVRAYVFVCVYVCRYSTYAGDFFLPIFSNIPRIFLRMKIEQNITVHLRKKCRSYLPGHYLLVPVSCGDQNSVSIIMTLICVNIFTAYLLLLRFVTRGWRKKSS